MRNAPLAVDPLEPRTLFAVPAGPGDTLPNITDTATDAAGNVYRAGTFAGTLDFDPSPDTTFNLAAQSTDAYVAKFTPRGTFLWARRWGTARPTALPQLAVTPAGDVYLAADYSANVDANPSPAATTTLAAAGANRNVFLVRLDRDGNFVRANAFATPAQDMLAADLATTPDGHVVLVANGQVPGIASPDDQKGDAHYYLLSARLRTLVHQRWGTLTPTGVVEARSMGVGPAGETYIAGATAPGVDFAPGRRVRTVNGPMRDNPFLLRIDPTGAFNWVLSYTYPAGAPPTIAITHVGADTVDVAGTYPPNTDFNSSPHRQLLLSPTGGAYAAEYASTGALVFAEDTSPPLPPT